MRVLFVLIAAAALLAGCAKKPMEVDHVSKISSKNGDSGEIDVYAKRRRAGEAVPEFTGDQIVQIRTYAGDSSNGMNPTGEEIAGATCDVSARDYSAKVTTPAKLRVPIYRMRSSALVVACSKDGYKNRTVDFNVYNKTKSDRYSAGASAGVLGLLAMAAVNGMSDESKHDFIYPPLQVVLEPNQKNAKTAARQ